MRRADNVKNGLTSGAVADEAAGRVVDRVAAVLGSLMNPPTAACINHPEPEFVRVADLRVLAGIKRGKAYQKINDGTFKSINLREPGKKFGVRLIYWPSVKNWLLSLLKEQNPEL